MSSIKCYLRQQKPWPRTARSTLSKVHRRSNDSRELFGARCLGHLLLMGVYNWAPICGAAAKSNGALADLLQKIIKDDSRRHGKRRPLAFFVDVEQVHLFANRRATNEAFILDFKLFPTRQEIDAKAEAAWEAATAQRNAKGEEVLLQLYDLFVAACPTFSTERDVFVDVMPPRARAQHALKLEEQDKRDQAENVLSRRSAFIANQAAHAKACAEAQERWPVGGGTKKQRKGLFHGLVSPKAMLPDAYLLASPPFFDATLDCPVVSSDVEATTFAAGCRGRRAAGSPEGHESDWAMRRLMRAYADAGYCCVAVSSDYDFVAFEPPEVVAYSLSRSEDDWSLFDNFSASQRLPKDLLTRRLWALSQKSDYFPGLAGVGAVKLRNADIQQADDVLDFLDQLSYKDKSVAGWLTLALECHETLLPIAAYRVNRARQAAGRPLLDAVEARVARELPHPLAVHPTPAGLFAANENGRLPTFAFRYPLPVRTAAAQLQHDQQVLRRAEALEHRQMHRPAAYKRDSAHLSAVRIGAFPVPQWNGLMKEEPFKKEPLAQEQKRQRKLKRTGALDKEVARRVRGDRARQLNRIEIGSFQQQRAEERPFKRRKLKAGEQSIAAGGQAIESDAQDKLYEDEELFGGDDDDEDDSLPDLEPLHLTDRRRERKAALDALGISLKDDDPEHREPAIDADGKRKEFKYKAASHKKGMDAYPLRMYAQTADVAFNQLQEQHPPRMAESMDLFVTARRVEFGDVYADAVNELVMTIMARGRVELLKSGILQRLLVCLAVLLKERYAGPRSDDQRPLLCRAILKSTLEQRKSDRGSKLQVTLATLQDCSLEVLGRAVNELSGIYADLDDVLLESLTALFRRRGPLQLAALPGFKTFWEQVATDITTNLLVASKTSFIRHFAKVALARVGLVYDAVFGETGGSGAKADKAALAVELVHAVLNETIQVNALLARAYIAPAGLEEEVDFVLGEKPNAREPAHELRIRVRQLFGQLSRERDTLILRERVWVDQRGHVESLTTLRHVLAKQPQHILKLHHAFKIELSGNAGYGVLMNIAKARKRKMFHFTNAFTCSFIDGAASIAEQSLQLILAKAPLELPAYLAAHVVYRPTTPASLAQGGWRDGELARLSDAFKAEHRAWRQELWRRTTGTPLGARSTLAQHDKRGLALALADHALNNDLPGVSFLTFKSDGWTVLRQYYDVSQSTRPPVDGAAIRSHFVTVAGEDAGLFAVSAYSKVRTGFKFVKAKDGRTLKQVAIQLSYLGGRRPPAVRPLPPPQTAHDRLTGLEYAGHAVEVIRWTQPCPKRGGIYSNIIYVKDQADIKAVIARYTQPKFFGGEGWPLSRVLEAFANPAAVDSGRVFNAAVFAAPLFEVDRIPLNIFDRSRLLVTDPSKLVRQTVEYKLKSQSFEEPIRHHARATEEARADEAVRLEQAQMAGTAGGSNLGAMKLNNKTIRNEDLIMRYASKANMSKAVDELLNVLGYDTSTVWTPETAGATAQPATLIYGHDFGGSTLGLHTADRVNTFLCAVADRVAALRLPVIIIRLSEFCTSVLCPRRACRDQAVERREYMDHTVRLNVLGQARTDKFKDVIRILQCPRCGTPFHKDLSAAENMCYAWWHLWVFGRHPYRK